MAADLEPPMNAVGKIEAVVREQDTAAALASHSSDAYPAVLSTTHTIAMLELAAGRVLTPLLQPGQLSVGVEVNVTHSAPTLPRAKVIAVARYTGRAGKLYVFEVVAYDAAGEIMRGEHSRAIIDVERLLATAARRNP